MKHLADYQRIHRENPRYGSGPGAADRAVLQSWMSHETPRAVIDYGCGNSRAVFDLFPAAQAHFRHDPALRAFCAPPPPGLVFDAGLCTDVMEHIPEEEMDRTLERLRLLAPVWYLIIHTAPAAQKLPDGGNAHVSRHPPEWWTARFLQWFGAVETARLQAPYRFAMRAAK